MEKEEEKMKKKIKKSLLIVLSAVIMFSSLSVNVQAEMNYGNEHLTIQIIERDGLINIGIGELNEDVQVQSVTHIDDVVNFNVNRVYSFNVGEEIKPIFSVQYTYENELKEHVINYQVQIKALDEEISAEELTDEELVQSEIDDLTPEELEKFSGVDDRSWETEIVDKPVEYIESEYDEYIEMDEQYINYEKTNQISSYSLPNKVNVVKSNRFYGGFDHWRMPSHPQYHPSWQFYGWNWADLTVNGELVFCMDPEVKIPNGNGYNSTTDWEKLTEQQQIRIMLIGVYGSDYPGQDTELFKIAEQAMVWETVHHGSKWNRDFSKERAIINRRIADHKKTLKINGTTQKIKVGDTYTLTDPLLQDYIVKVGTGVKIVSNSGNTLKYKIESPNFDSTITFTKKSGRPNGKSVIYKKPGNQDIVAVRNSDPQKATLKLELSSSNYNIKKTDESGNPVSGAIYGMSYSNSVDSNGFLNSGVYKYTTGSNGQTSMDVWNYPGSTIYYQEIFAPNPYVIDKTIRKHVAVAGETKTFSVTNKKATGKIVISKKSETGVPYSGVKYEVKNGAGKVVATPITSKDGTVVVEIPLGNYTVKEISVPKELILDSVPKNVKISYKDQVTPIINVSTNFVNKYQPIVTYGIKKIQIDTQKQSSGLNVKTWFNKVQHYDYSINNFGDELITLDLVDTNIGKVVSSKTIKVKDLALEYEFKVSPSDLKVNSYSTYELVIKTNSPNKITINQQKLATDGYTASQQLLKTHADSNKKIMDKSVIRTERSYAKDMLTYYETTEISYEQIQPQRTGRGFEYDITALYKNDLNNSYELEFDFIPDKNLVDSSYLPYSKQEQPVFKLIKDENVYSLPKVRTEIRTGEVISEENWLKLNAEEKERYLDGGNKLYVPIWSTDLGSYNTQLKSKPIGVNEINVELNDYVSIFGFMFGWYDNKGISPSSEYDGIVTSPVLAHNPFPTGIPDNWGLTQSDGQKSLTSVEQEFFGQKSDYSVRYNLNGGTGIIGGDLVKNGGTHIVTDLIPVKTGSRFVGWELNGVSITSGQKITVHKDLNIQAIWKESNNRVEFNTNGGSSIDAVTVEYGTTVIKPIDPTKEGYTFKGWSPDINQVIVSDTTFSAIWEIDSFKVSFDTGGGTEIIDQVIKYGEHTEVPNNPQKTGYTFVGWLPDVSQPIKTDTRFEAQWEENFYVVSFDTQSEEMIDAQLIKHGKKIKVPEKPTRDGYTFMGWDPSIDIEIIEDIVFVAEWSLSTHLVEFDTDGGSFIKNQVVNHGESVQVPESPVKEGHTFLGWDIGLEVGIESHTIFKAIWSINTYSVTYIFNNGQASIEEIVEYGALPIFLEDPEREDFTFVEWLPSIDKPIVEDTVFVAQWEINGHKVQFESGTDTLIDYQIVIDGEKANEPDVELVREGYIFQGWSPDISETTILSEVTFTAIWEKKVLGLDIVEIQNESELLTDRFRKWWITPKIRKGR